MSTNNPEKVKWAKNVVRQIIGDYKERVGCADCGYNKHYAALDFDHLPNQDKIKPIATMVNQGYSLSAIFEEIEKYEVVCSNCHRIRTWLRKEFRWKDNT